jgi:hypothetical protein
VAAQPIVKIRAITCPNCGGTVQLRGFAHTLAATCSNCRTVLDTSTGEISILAKVQAKYKIEPLIPLGWRGKFDDVLYEIIGFQQRYINSGGETYYWQEYVLFHPYKGFRYLVESTGHWTFVSPTQVLPDGQYFQSYDGRVYKPFQKAVARTSFVIGEFPWRVAMGEAATTIDYVSPPYILSSEKNAAETTWSVGRYVTGAEVWKTFNLKGDPPKAEGVYANQPNPHEGKPRSYWKLFGVFFAIALAILIGFAVTHQENPVYSGRFTYDPAAQTDQAAVSPTFTLTGNHTSAVHIESRAKVGQNWVYLAIALVNKDTNISYDFSETLSYYSGVDGGESWEEGSPKGGTTVHQVPPGHYYVRVDPEREREAGETVVAASRTIDYTVDVYQGATNVGMFFIVILLLLPPPLIAWWRSRLFELQRWNESEMQEGGE